MSNKTKPNTVRIIAGQWRSRRLPVVDKEGLRPTTDRIRETVFNWLMNDIPDARCLDLFAGSGALGLECLSRGARLVQFVEKDPLVVSTLRQNLVTLQAEALQPETPAEVIEADALSFLQQRPMQKFDIVFLDPPFKATLLGQAVSLLEDNRWLAESALIYLEQPSKQLPAKVPDTWVAVKQGIAGQSCYALYRS
ncbi:MAG: 16S rRNA (guanine(966)-N(2))-methyltransferase RsmD [Arenicella sp.]|nr:16S rRNA (guanine(966)-N(2))-methyltransferase RsmD [Arenicella sp.]